MQKFNPNEYKDLQMSYNPHFLRFIRENSAKIGNINKK